MPTENVLPTPPTTRDKDAEMLGSEMGCPSGKTFSCVSMSRGFLTRPPKDVLFPGHAVTFLLALAMISPASWGYFDSSVDKWLMQKALFNKR